VESFKNLLPLLHLYSTPVQKAVNCRKKGGIAIRPLVELIKIILKECGILKMKGLDNSSN